MITLRYYEMNDKKLLSFVSKEKELNFLPFKVANNYITIYIKL